MNKQDVYNLCDQALREGLTPPISLMPSERKYVSRHISIFCSQRGEELISDHSTGYLIIRRPIRRVLATAEIYRALSVAETLLKNRKNPHFRLDPSSAAALRREFEALIADANERSGQGADEATPWSDPAMKYFQEEGQDDEAII